MKPSGRGMVAWPAVVLFLICSTLAANSQSIIALVGSGSNLPTPLYSHWIEEYNKLSAGVQVRYLSTGTVKGIEDISRGVGDFAAGEVPMSDEQVKEAQSSILHIPTGLVAIGYIELGFTLADNSVGVGHVQNASGKYIGATQSSIAAAYHSAEKSIPADFRASLTNVAGNDAYPIVSFTWLYVPGKSADQERSRALANFLEWALSMGEQSAEQHGYTPLPASLAPKVLAKVHSLR